MELRVPLSQDGPDHKSSELTYTQLPPAFFAPVHPSQFADPHLYVLNKPLAGTFGLNSDWLSSAEGTQLLSGEITLNEGDAIAMAYAGHQFGHYSPLLGDGRAMLVGELKTADNLRYDLHLKGSGATPFSRGGDGKATLGSAIREYVMSEAMAALGVPTTRSLAIVTTGENVMRSGPFPGAVLARTARSHVRVGTFEYASATGDLENLRALADFSIDRLYPNIQSDGATRYADFFTAVATAQAQLIAKWMSLGFIHGVMNTDNCSIAGETIDYGPCAFLDRFDPGKVFSSIDHQRRYAWNRQAEIGQWNLAQLAQTLLPVLGDTQDAQVEAARAGLSNYVKEFQAALHTAMANKLGISAGYENLTDFITQTVTAMATGGVDFTLFFTALTRHAAGGSDAETWLEAWQDLRQKEAGSVELMQASNPVRIPRNHQVERAIADGEAGNAETMTSLMKALREPFAEDASLAGYEAAPTDDEIVTQTFCGT
ncbi:UNVERIFIED_CONTAM: hypothetical protein GTU68_044593 [Idotea baltica]|nr:hypothetical protein [Idotea baltica]